MSSGEATKASTLLARYEEISKGVIDVIPERCFDIYVDDTGYVHTLLPPEPGRYMRWRDSFGRTAIATPTKFIFQRYSAWTHPYMATDLPARDGNFYREFRLEDWQTMADDLQALSLGAN